MSIFVLIITRFLFCIHERTTVNWHIMTIALPPFTRVRYHMIVMKVWDDIGPL